MRAVYARVLTAANISEYGVRDHGGGGVFVSIGQHDFHAVGGQYFERTGTGWYRQRVCVNAEKQRAANFPLGAVIANSLTDRQNMSLVESIFKRGTTMARRTKCNSLLRRRKIRRTSIIGRNSLGTSTSIASGAGLPAKELTFVELILSLRSLLAEVFRWIQTSRSYAPIRQTDPSCR
jgi:hypothetical protein